MSAATWDPTAGGDYLLEELVGQISSIVAAEGLDGVSISGGEPTEQALAIEALLIGLQPLRRQDVDILLFSGLTTSRFRRSHAALLDLVDAAVIGPYQAASPGRPPLLASGNQELLACSHLGRTRYTDQVDQMPQRIQIAPDATGAVLVGLPVSGDIDRLHAALSRTDVPERTE